MPREVIMPALGMAQDTGKLVAWLKQPGDAVAEGDPLFEVETDKSVVEVEAQASGFLSRVSASDGDDVPVGEVVATITDTREAPGEVAKPAPAENATYEEPKEGEALPEGKTVIMPALGMAQDTGKIVAWRKAPGDSVSAGDVLFEVETDKSVVEVEAGHDGYVAACLALDGEEIPVGEPAAIISADKPENPVQRSTADRAPSVSAPAEETSDTPDQEETETRTEAAPSGASVRAASGDRILASPKARWLAHQQGLDLKRLADHGVTQPFHVSDLETLRTLPAPATSPSSGQPEQMLLHVAASVETEGCDSFLHWIGEDGDITLPARLLWLRFAGAALRQARENTGEALVVELWRGPESTGRYQNPDRSRLSQPLAEDSEASADLVLRDFSASRISAATAKADEAPVLTVGLQRGDYVISLDYRETQLTEAQAFALVDGFAARLADPLQHIL